MTQETITKSDSGIFSEAEIKSIEALMAIMTSRMPTDQKNRLLTEGVNRHCDEFILGGGK